MLFLLEAIAVTIETTTADIALTNEINTKILEGVDIVKDTKWKDLN